MEILDLGLAKQGDQTEYVTDKEFVEKIVELVFAAISKETGAQMMMLTPVLNIAKLKIAKMDDNDAATIIQQVHRISREAEIHTGKYSPFHGDVNPL